VRRITAARLAASFRSAAASMLDVLEETTRREGFVSRAG